MCKVTVRSSNKDTASTAWLWAVMEKGEMGSRALFDLSSTPSEGGRGVGRWKEYRPDRASGVSCFLPVVL